MHIDIAANTVTERDMTPEEEALIPQAKDQGVPSITRRQLRRFLLTRGFTDTHVRAVIEAIPDDMERGEATIEWEDGTTYSRTHSLIVHLAPAFGLLTSDQIADAFREAATF